MKKGKFKAEFLENFEVEDDVDIFCKKLRGKNSYSIIHFSDEEGFM